MICSSIEEEKAMANFFASEHACNEHNRKQIEAMNLSHLPKGKLAKTKSAISRWHKEAMTTSKWCAAQIKKPDHKRHLFTAQERTWLPA